MTFFEWIRKCLQWDAKKHPLPKEKSASIRKTLRQMKKTPK